MDLREPYNHTADVTFWSKGCLFDVPIRNTPGRILVTLDIDMLRHLTFALGSNLHFHVRTG